MKETLLRFLASIIIIIVLIPSTGIHGDQSGRTGAIDVPTVEWVISFGGISQDRATGVQTDDASNVYIIGTFREMVDFDPGPGTHELESNGETDVYLCKLDKTGNFVWAGSWGSVGIDIVHDLCIDPAGYIYVIGGGTGIIESGDEYSWQNTLKGHKTNAYVIKFDLSGNYHWATTIGCEGYTTGESVAVDSGHSIYLGGYFTERIDLETHNGPVVLNSAGDGDSYICKLDESGNVHWARSWGSSGREDCSGIAVGPDDGIYVYGAFSETVDFNPGDGQALKTAYLLKDNAYLSKFDPDGNFQWIRTWNGHPPTISSGIASGRDGNILLTGSFYFPVDLDPTYLIERHESARLTDCFISAFDISGDYIYGIPIGGGGYERGCEIATDESQNSYLYGIFSAEADFDPGEGMDSFLSRKPNSYFLSKFDSQMSYCWTRVWDCCEANISVDIASDNDGGIYCVGSFEETIDFDLPGGTESFESNGNHDVFLMKLAVN